MAERLRLFAAVVLEGVVAARIDALRWALGSTELERIPPHITLVPPTNVAAEALPGLLADLRSTVRDRAPFSVGLGPISTFPRPEPVVFVAVDDSSGALRTLAGSLAEGALSSSSGAERHPFVPHVTLVNRASPVTAAAALAALGGVWSTLEVDAVTLLRLDRFGDATRWLPIAAYGLGGPLVRGRGGLEIELYRSAVVDPETEAVLGGRVDPVPPGAVRWSVTARVGGIVVGAACGFVRGGAVSLDTLVVDPSHTRIGIASRMVELAEDDAADSVVVRARSALEAEFLAGRGYREMPGGADDPVRFRRDR